jgi:hypothetical protein
MYTRCSFQKRQIFTKPVWVGHLLTMQVIEVPVETVQEQMNEVAGHNGGWLSRAALTAAILAVFAALAAFADIKKQQEEIAESAKEHEQESMLHFRIHETLARAVTFFQIAIAISAISVLTRRKSFWHLAIAFGLCGVGFFAASFF